MGRGEIQPVSGEAGRDGQGMVEGTSFGQSGETPAGNAPYVYRRVVRADGRLSVRNLQTSYMEASFQEYSYLLILLY